MPEVVIIPFVAAAVVWVSLVGYVEGWWREIFHTLRGWFRPITFRPKRRIRAQQVAKAKAERLLASVAQPPSLTPALRDYYTAKKELRLAEHDAWGAAYAALLPKEEIKLDECTDPSHSPMHIVTWDGTEVFNSCPDCERLKIEADFRKAGMVLTTPCSREHQHQWVTKDVRRYCVTGGREVFVTQRQYDNLAAAGLLNPDWMYLIT